jgi:uncharacterized protein (DUF4415 family)
MKHQKIEPEVDLTDPDNPEWTAADFARAKTAEELWGPEFKNFLVRKPGRPPMPPQARKKSVGIRLSPDVLDALKATGPNWQRRADEALRSVFVKKGAA